MLALLFSACAPSYAYRIERRVGGATRASAYVSPYSYEHFVRGELARAHEDWAAAIHHYRQARSGAADDPLVLARMAEAYDRLDQTESANQALRMANEIDDCPEAAYLAEGRIAARHSDWETAVVAYENAVECGSGDSEAAIRLAEALREAGAEERADAVLAQYLATAERGAEIRRAQLALALARHDARAAGRAALALVQESPHDRELVSQGIELLLEQNHPLLAARILRYLPPSSVSRTLELRVAIANHDETRARAILLERPTLSMVNEDRETEDLESTAGAWLEVGRAEQALELADLAESSRSPWAALMRARALLALGRPGEAAQAAARIIPGMSRYREAEAVLLECLRVAALPALARELELRLSLQPAQQAVSQ